MAIDIKDLEKKLAQHKVYDAWQYVKSLRETLGYMTVSYELLSAVYTHRLSTLQALEQEMLQRAISSGQASYGTSEMERTNLNIGGFSIDDVVFLRKTSMEFFHYARISMDVLFQIANAALLGDKAYDVDDKGLLRKLLTKLGGKPEFSKLLQLLDANKNDVRYQYLTAFDNYIKHIKTILITVKNSFLIGDTNTFSLNEFCYDGTYYPSENAIDKIQELNNYVTQTIEAILEEVLLQIPNCYDNSHRIQAIKYKQIFQETEKGSVLEYMSFFIEVEQDLSELPQEIKVLPLIIKPNDEIYSFDFKFDKIFIKKKGSTESDIIGCAHMKNGLETNEFYRTFTVTPCDLIEYYKYISTFKNTYSKITFNIYAMEGEMLFIKD